MQKLIKQIEQWADDRNLIEGSTPQKQMLKLMEEFGELCGGIAKNKPEVIKDSIGDCFVVLTILNKQLGLEPELNFNWFSAGVSSPEEQLKYTLRYLHELTWQPCSDWLNEFITELNAYAKHYGLTAQECLQHAYNQIKDRKGKMIDGVFIKSEDLENE